MKWITDSIFQHTEEEFKQMFRSLDPLSQQRILRLKDIPRKKESILARHLLQQLGQAPCSSISHAQGICAVVISQTPVGIDIAAIRPYRVRSICTLEEWHWAQEDALRCTLLLTAKEAAFKLGQKPDCLLYAVPVPGFLLCVAYSREIQP